MRDDDIRDAMARAQRYAVKARAEAEDDLARIRRENPDFALLADELRELCGGKVSYLNEFATGKTWGMTVEERAKRDGGIGVSVPACMEIKVKRRRAPRQS